MYRKLALVTMALAGLVATGGSAFANSPSLKPFWSISWHVEPDRDPVGKNCVQFKTTNKVLGVTQYSGTWTSPDYPEWKGQWIQRGDQVHWWGAYPPTGYFFSMIGNLATGKVMVGKSFSIFAGDGTSTNAGNFVMKREPCEVALRAQKGGAPGPVVD